MDNLWKFMTNFMQNFVNFKIARKITSSKPSSGLDYQRATWCFNTSTLLLSLFLNPLLQNLQTTSQILATIAEPNTQETLAPTENFSWYH